MRSVESRLSALERSARRWRVAAIVFASLFLGVLSAGAGKNTVMFDTVFAKTFAIIDDKQEPLVMIKSDLGGGVITLLTRAGEKGPAIRLSVDEKTGVWISGDKGDSGFTLTTDNDTASSAVHSKTAQVRMMVLGKKASLDAVAGDGSDGSIYADGVVPPQFRSADAKNNTIWQAPSRERN